MSASPPHLLWHYSTGMQQSASHWPPEVQPCPTCAHPHLLWRHLAGGREAQRVQPLLLVVVAHLGVVIEQEGRVKQQLSAKHCAWWAEKWPGSRMQVRMCTHHPTLIAG